ncbi:MAG: T9SS type A sorting domain-containing protein [Ignavibacteria bacterium]
MKTLIAALLFTITSSILSQSTYTNIQISNLSGPNEPSICINPKNTNQIVAGANTDKVYRSTDGGLTWTFTTLTSTYTVWGDPCIITDTLGNFYYFHLVNGAGFIDRMGCQKSTNAGTSWSAGTFWQFNGKQQDKEWAITDFTGGPRGNWIFVSWTEFDNYGTPNPADSSRILFARSTDGGTSFTGITRLSKLGGDCVDEDYTTEGAVPAVGPNGEIYVAWAGPQGTNNFKIFFDRSTDGGTTWLDNDIIAASQPGGWDLGSGSPTGRGILGIYRGNGLPVTVCDISNGPYRGTIYINYLDSVGTRDRDVKIVKSTNGGLNWSAPIRVNDDAAGKEQFFTWLTIDRVTGYLYCVFYDRRNYTDNQTDVFLARSTNGGTTWVNERISSSPFLPAYNIFFGDYNNISAHNGIIRPIWIRLVSGTLSVWTAVINYPVGITQISGEIPETFQLSQNYPNPFNPSTKIKFDIPAIEAGTAFDVRIRVYDVLGKQVAVIVNQKMASGTYEYEWNAADLTSGVYFYTLDVKDSKSKGIYRETRKMVLTK